jgi:hypothetical protein
MKHKSEKPQAVKDLCRKLKIQLDELSVTLENPLPLEEKSRRSKLMEQLKQQLAELS